MVSQISEPNETFVAEKVDRDEKCVPRQDAIVNEEMVIGSEDVQELVQKETDIEDAHGCVGEPLHVAESQANGGEELGNNAEVRIAVEERKPEEEIAQTDFGDAQADVHLATSVEGGEVDDEEAEVVDENVHRFESAQNVEGKAAHGAEAEVADGEAHVIEHSLASTEHVQTFEGKEAGVDVDESPAIDEGANSGEAKESCGVEAQVVEEEAHHTTDAQFVDEEVRGVEDVQSAQGIEADDEESQVVDEEVHGVEDAQSVDAKEADGQESQVFDEELDGVEDVEIAQGIEADGEDSRVVDEEVHGVEEAPCVEGKEADDVEARVVDGAQCDEGKEADNEEARVMDEVKHGVEDAQSVEGNESDGDEAQPLPEEAHDARVGVENEQTDAADATPDVQYPITDGKGASGEDTKGDVSRDLADTGKTEADGAQADSGDSPAELADTEAGSVEKAQSKTNLLLAGDAIVNEGEWGVEKTQPHDMDSLVGALGADVCDGTALQSSTCVLGEGLKDISGVDTTSIQTPVQARRSTRSSTARKRAMGATAAEEPGSEMLQQPSKRSRRCIAPSNEGDVKSPAHTRGRRGKLSVPDSAPSKRRKASQSMANASAENVVVASGEETASARVSRDCSSAVEASGVKVSSRRTRRAAKAIESIGIEHVANDVSASSPSEPPRRRGRPRKKSSSLANAGADVSVPEVLPSRRSSRRKIGQREEEAESKIEASSNCKGRRNKTAEVQEVIEKPTTRRMSRKRPVESQVDAIETEHAVPSTRRRSRRKIEETQEDEKEKENVFQLKVTPVKVTRSSRRLQQSSTEAEVEQEMPKRRGGRSKAQPKSRASSRSTKAASVADVVSPVRTRRFARLR